MHVKHLLKIENKYREQRLPGALLCIICQVSFLVFWIMASQNIKKHHWFWSPSKAEFCHAFFFLHSLLNYIFEIFSCVTKCLILFYISNIAVQPTVVLLVYLVSLSIDHLLILSPSSLQLWEVMEKNILWLNLHHTHDFFISVRHTSCQWNLPGGGALSLQVQSSTVCKFLWVFY